MKQLIATILFFGLAVAVQAAVKTETVNFSDGDEQYQGYIAYDDAIQGKRPGVMVVHEWWGLGDYEKRRARELAALGYVALAMDMYGKGKHTDNPEQAKTWMQAVTADVEWWREHAAMGVDILRKHALVDAGKIAAIGYCFGGGTMLQMAYGGTGIAGVVSFHGALPVADKEALASIRTKLLVLHGDADPFVRDEIEAQFRKALASSSADWQMINYGGVRHSFTNPAADARGMDALKYDAIADQRSWQAMQAFFTEIFSD